MKFSLVKAVPRFLQVDKVRGRTSEMGWVPERDSSTREGSTPLSAGTFGTAYPKSPFDRIYCSFKSRAVSRYMAETTA